MNISFTQPRPPREGATPATPENTTGSLPAENPTKQAPKWRRVPLPSVPLLRGQMTPRLRVKSIAVWCQHCQHCHVHRWNPDEGSLNKIEHRAAHCDPRAPRDRRSPFLATGYNVGLTKFEQGRIWQERYAAKKATRERGAAS